MAGLSKKQREAVVMMSSNTCYCPLTNSVRFHNFAGGVAASCTPANRLPNCPSKRDESGRHNRVSAFCANPEISRLD